MAEPTTATKNHGRVSQMLAKHIERLRGISPDSQTSSHVREIEEFARTNRPLLSLRDIRRSFAIGPLVANVLNGVSLDIFAGDFLSIMGTSGSGKSTLLNIMGLLDRASSGTLQVVGRQTSDMNDDELSDTRNHSIGFVFQAFRLLTRMSAIDNVAVPLAYRGFESNYAKECAERMLHRVGMGDKLENRPDQLSGGQQQRVSIARALVSNPAILLADEPTGALDPNTGKEIMQLFKDLNADDGTTVVIITHDVTVAHQCTRNVRLIEGTIEERSSNPNAVAPSSA